MNEITIKIVQHDGFYTLSAWDERERRPITNRVKDTLHDTIVTALERSLLCVPTPYNN
jgi:hypothetical protein